MSATLSEPLAVGSGEAVFKARGRVTNTALFRDRDQWSLSTAGRVCGTCASGTAASRRRQIAGGVPVGATIVAHPFDEIRDGTGIRTRMQ